MREIKFRCWNTRHNVMVDNCFPTQVKLNNGYLLYMQYTGLKDKNGIEIYEHMEIDEKYEVQFIKGSYVLINISNKDIITLSNYLENRDGQITVTKEYTKV